MMNFSPDVQGEVYVASTGKFILYGEMNYIEKQLLFSIFAFKAAQ
jgi:hypothetical protein